MWLVEAHHYSTDVSYMVPGWDILRGCSERKDPCLIVASHSRICRGRRGEKSKGGGSCCVFRVRSWAHAWLRHMLTWAAATERLGVAAVMTVGERLRQKPVADGILTIAHAIAGSGPSGDFVRLLAGGDTAAWQVQQGSIP